MENRGMRLRVRAAGGGATHRIQVPAPARIYDLRHALSQTIGVPADSIRLSLNKRDEIEGDASAPLEAYGIRPGDLLYYFDRDLGFSGSRTGEAVSREVERRELCASAADKRAREQKAALAEESSATRSRVEAVDRNAGQPSPPQVEEQRRMEEEAVNRDVEQEQGSEERSMEGEEEEVRNKYCHLIPNLLSRLLSVEGKNVGNSRDLLILAVHAVMLETGFVILGRPTIAGASSIKYTLPELGQLKNDEARVLLRCQSVGEFMVVYGSVQGSSQIFRLSLSISKFLGEVLVEGESKGGGGGSQEQQYQASFSLYKDAFALWKEIKDNLTLRLLMLLCEIAGLPLPACFQILPTELKMKILEFLPALDVARISMVSSELRFLAANNDLWRMKFAGESFKLKQGEAPPASWKVAFVREWYARKRRERIQVLSRRDVIVPRRNLRPHHPWGIIGGDYDAYPEIPFLPARGGINPFGGLRFRRPLNPGCIGPASSGIGSGGGALPELSRPGENPLPLPFFTDHDHSGNPPFFMDHGET
ncbi:F-box protein SKIP22-like [Selaginella moellendorffii]|uniref:F-box protein SKIP22-like n=1 Tax=Selaginella moellendorffii TaxID=88036 RepID=UPI000D1C6A4F|nr:F-box protein SKIP22-like [Selaginella moellendorffii]|eukprot:XP_024515920.1 F-box protein SKIP22-like [Selaginella moellendorffii]